MFAFEYSSSRGVQWTLAGGSSFESDMSGLINAIASKVLCFQLLINAYE